MLVLVKEEKQSKMNFKKKGFYYFNSRIFSWKMIDDLNNFEIFPVVCKDLNVNRCLIL